MLLELAEPDRDVGHLDAGVVDVVLDLDLAAEEPQQPAERVAERGVAQVSDVRRLVRVDRRVLDDRLPGGADAAAAGAGEPAGEKAGPIEEEVDVAVRRRLDARDAVDGAEGADDFLGDRARRLAEPARQLERERDREIAERAARRDLDRDRASAGSSAGMPYRRRRRWPPSGVERCR